MTIGWMQHSKSDEKMDVVTNLQYSQFPEFQTWTQSDNDLRRLQFENGSFPNISAGDKQMYSFPSTRREGSDISESSATTYDLYEYKDFLEKNARHIAEKMDVDLLMPNLPEYLPREDILKAEQENTGFGAALTIIHSVMRNLGSGAFQKFISEIKEKQPGLLALVNDSPHPDSIYQKCDVTVHQLIWKYSGSERSVLIVTNQRRREGLLESLKKFEPHELLIQNINGCGVEMLDVRDICNFLFSSEKIEFADWRQLNHSKLSEIVCFTSKLYDLKILAHMNIPMLDSCMSGLVSCLAYKHELVTLCIDGCKISSKGWVLLTEGLEQLTGLRKLSLNKTDLRDSGSEVLWRGFEKHIHTNHDCQAGESISGRGLSDLEVLEIKDNNLTMASWSSLMNIRANCPSLEKIDIDGNKELLFATAAAMCENDQSSMLSRFFLKDELNFRNHNLSDHQVFKVSKAMMNIPLKTVNLRNCKIGDAGAEVLIEMFIQRKLIIDHLDLSENDLTDKAASIYASACKIPITLLERLWKVLTSWFWRTSHTLTEVPLRLDLENNYISDQSFSYIRQCSLSPSRLVYLSLKGNRIGTLQSQVLVEMLNNLKSLRYLSLRKNKLGDAGAEHIANGLNKKSQLLELDLGENNITLRGLGCIGDQLKENRQLQYLDVSNNGASASVKEHRWGICNALAINKSLFKLNMADIHLPDPCLSQLINTLLHYNKTLTHLNLVSNEIGQHGVIMLGKLLKSTTSLKHLNISRNRNIGYHDPKMEKLGEGIEKNRTLTFLGMSKIRIVTAAIKRLSRALGKNKKLIMVDLTGNNIKREEFENDVRKSGSHVQIIFDNDSGEDYLDHVLYTDFPFVP